MRGLLPVFILVAALVMAEGAICQDPGTIDSLVFGNPDGSPILVNIGVEVSIPIWLKCDENVAFVNLAMATQNQFVAERQGGVAIGPMTQWDLQFLEPAINWPALGLTTQTFLGITDFVRPAPNYINTNNQWAMIGAFKIRTTSDSTAMGRISQLLPGEDPTQGLTVMFDEYWNPIVPAMKYSQLHFQQSNPPVILSPPDDTTYYLSGLFPFTVPFIASDNDNQAITLSVDFPYTGYQLTRVEERPGYSKYNFSWTPSDSLNALAPLNFIATDITRATDVNSVVLDVKPITVKVSIDSVLPGYSAEAIIDFDINGTNSRIAAFNLLISYDPNVLTYQGTDFLSGVQPWEYTIVTINPLGPGTLKLIGVANLYGSGHPLLSRGNHSIARVRFTSPNQPGLGGLFVPLVMPREDYSSNVLSDSSGMFVFHPVLDPGGVFFLSSSSYLLGDINQNGSAYEVGDVVVLAAYLADPVNNPLSSIQMAASDVNQDGQQATIADLIYLINIVNGTVHPPLGGATPGKANLVLDVTDNQATLRLKANSPAGGVLVKINHVGSQIENLQVPEGLQLKYVDSADMLSALIYSPDGRVNIGETILNFRIRGGDKNQVAVQYFEISDIHGQLFEK
jgi:hypothetical protein